MTEVLPVKINNMYCTAGNRYLLQNINWEIKKGEHWLLFGMNGCGKTTLLSIVAGFKQHDSGTVELFGEAYGNNNTLKLRKKIGWISASFFDKIYRSEKDLSKPFRIANTYDMLAYKAISIDKVPKYTSAFTAITSDNADEAIAAERE